jgi:hypothetical protein
VKLVVEDSLISKVDALAVADEFDVRALMAHAARLRDEGHGNVITYSRTVFIPGDDLSAVILEALGASKGNLCDGDILIIAQKIVSKAEDRLVRLTSVDPSPETQTLAREVHKDPRVVEPILRESTEVVRHRRDVLIVAHRLGFVMANACAQPVHRQRITASPGASHWSRALTSNGVLRMPWASSSAPTARATAIRRRLSRQTSRGPSPASPVRRSAFLCA